MPYIIPETMPNDWLVDFAIDDDSGQVADAMRAAYASGISRHSLDTLMGRLKAACLAAAENAKPAGLTPRTDWQDWPDNAADHN